jgi:uncharacterized protein (DUF697 family)
MLNVLKQVRAAFGMLNPDEVRKRANQRIQVGLVAASDAGYAEMEDFLVPPSLPREERIERMGMVHRAGDANVPSKVDLVLYQGGIHAEQNAHSFRRDDPYGMMDEILDAKPDLELAIANQFPAFRNCVVDRIIMSVAKENALFAVATALPNIVPSMMELPWAFGEFASDTAFLTANQIRMAFQIAAASGKNVGLSDQKGSVVAIVGSAFGWRAIARELAGKIPLGEGLIPKGAIAFAGTYVMGKGLQRVYSDGQYAPAERESMYKEALEQGKAMVRSLQKRA